MGAGCGDTLVADVVRQLERSLLDRAVGQHGDTEHDPRREPDELHRAHHRPFEPGRHDDCGVVGEVGEQAAGVVQHLLDLAVGPGEELAHLLALDGRQRPRGRELVDEEAVALVGGHAPRAGVGLGQIAVAFEQRHLVAHGGGRNPQAAARDMGGPDRLGRLDVLPHDGPQNGGLSIVERHWRSTR